jgi:hypothetical protein
MPIYLYACSNCKYILWQDRQSKDRDDLRPCNRCGTGELFRRTNADLSLAELTLSSSDKAPTPNEDRPRFLLQRVGFKNFHTAVKAEGNEGYSGDMDVM